MTASLLLKDLSLWSLQMGILTAIGVLLPRLLALTMAKARLAFCQLVLLTSLLLPLLHSWKPDAIAGNVTVSTGVALIAPAAVGNSRALPLSSMLLIVIAAGILIRLGFLLSGLSLLRRYRLESHPLSPASAWGVEADLRISEEVSGPVTFGFRRPIVLLPARFLSLHESMRDAILAHEILHVRRRDWLFTVGEELVRALFWFHPAIWWLLREIQLAREQAVDREAVEITKARDRYIDALLVIAGAPQSDLAPAPLFLRRRHLKQRVASILNEVRMSTAKSLSAFGASLTILAASCWFITGAFPLHAAPQIAADAQGVAVDTNGAELMHREGVTYPPDAIAKGIQGTVVANVTLDAAGNVTDATIVSGPEELRKQVLQSLLNWHFTRDAAATGTREISVAFALPSPAVRVRAADTRLPDPSVPPIGAVVKSIVVGGLAGPVPQQLLDQLPLRLGDTVTPDNFAALVNTARAFDSHLNVTSYPVSATEVAIRVTTDRGIGAATPPPAIAPPSAPPGALRIGGNVQNTRLVTQPKPVYPPLAKAAHVQGTVRFEATIGADGKVVNLQLVSGPPLLVQSAMEAVQQLVYEPTLLNGNAVPVITTVDINYTLAE